MSRPRRAGSITTTPEITPDQYQQLIRRIREIVMEAVRPGARVLVVSRGDDELLRFDNRVAWHFPRIDSGSYAGYHPASSEGVIEHLEALRERGAQHLLVPAPSFWWRDYYPELFEYLAQNATAVWDDDACLIFELVGAGVEGEGRQAPPSVLARPLERLLEALLPEGTTVAILTSGDSSFLALEGCETVPFPQGSEGRYDGELGGGDALEQLTDLYQRGAEFLVVPHVAPSWLDSYPGFLEQVEARYCRIARRERVCTVYELNGHAESQTSPDRGGERVGGVTSWLRRAAARLTRKQAEQGGDV